MVLHVETQPPPRAPRAPSEALWNAMSPAERRAVVDALPAAMTEQELQPSEGDAHFDAKSEGRDTLRTYFSRAGKPIYVAAELTTYYPDEERFSPDLCAVCDVPLRPREKWVVSDEGKGLDWVLEVLVRGDRHKDLELNRVRYARLRIPEYFVFDRRHGVLRGWRLADPMIGIYQPIVPQHGVFHSSVLGLELTVEDRRLRFRQGSALVLAPKELLERLEDHVTDLVVGMEEAERRAADAEQRAVDAEARAETAERRAEEERTRAESALQRALALEAELERLRRG